MAFALRAQCPPEIFSRVEAYSIGAGEIALGLYGGLPLDPAKKKYKMDIFKSFATDTDLELNGRWVNLSKTARVRVARSGNEKFNKTLRKMIERESLDLKDESPGNVEILQGLLIKATAEAILVGWEGLEKDGAPLPYSREAAAELLAIKDFRARIEKIADDAAGYRLKAAEEQGND